MKIKKFLVFVLSVTMMLSLVACDGGDNNSTPTPSAAPSGPTYVYGMAGDMFRAYVNAVSSDDFDEVMTYLAIDESTIVTKEEVKEYLMSQKIGNLIHESYRTVDIKVAESGTLRGVDFYYLLKGESKEDMINGTIKLCGTEWKVYLGDMFTDKATLKLPVGSYTKIKIDDKELDVNDYTVSGDYQVYKLPQVSCYPKDIEIVRKDGKGCSGELTWTYSVSKSGKITDDASRTISEDKFKSVVASQPVQTEPSEEPETNNVETLDAENNNTVDTSNEVGT